MTDLLPIGLAREDITPEVHGVGMLGWGIPGNVVRGVRTRLHARALVLEPAQGAPFALLSLEICYPTGLLRRAILAGAREAGLPFSPSHLLLTATHTHSAPGGYSEFRFDNASIPGRQPEVIRCLVEGSVRALARAWQERRPGRLRWAEGEIPPERPVAFNRSLRALHRNPDLPRRYGPDERHLAVDRRLTLLRVEDEGGRARGLLAWFGVHNTSVHSDNTLIHADNKGYASTLCEEAGGPGFVALFLQGATGDVTPNHRRWPGRPLPGGSDPDDDRAALDNGRIQAEEALRLLHEAAGAPALAATVRCWWEERDMGGVRIDPELAGGRAGLSTVSGAVGARMLRGTWEGPGTPRPVGALLHLFTRGWQLWRRLTGPLRDEAARRWLAHHARKAPLLAVGEGTVLGQGWTVHLVPRSIDPIVGFLSDEQRREGTRPWLPQHLPLQLCRIGDFAILALPCEPTTTAMRRLEALARAELGVRRVRMTGYCNDYSGYVTTPEEYDVQGYEGAFTQFGQWTLLGWMQRIRELARGDAADPAR